MGNNNTKVALLCAYTLARAGQYGEAESLILSDGELAKTTEAVDLLARIRMEQGDEGEARRLWQEIQTVHPEHEPSRVALRNLGRSAVKMPWKALCLLLVPLVLAGGMVVGALLYGRAREWRVQWEQIPRAVEFEALAPYRGKVGRVLISSRFFAEPSRVGNRQLLAGMIAEAVAVRPEEVFIGDGGSEENPEAIEVVLQEVR